MWIPHKELHTTCRMKHDHVEKDRDNPWKGFDLRSYFILYVHDQLTSTTFYARVLGYPPRLNVPGMTEFALTGGAILGLMPESGIRRLLGPRLPDPANARGIPRAELYLLVDEPAAYLERALAAGAAPLSPLQPRDWDHLAAYCLDPDGHVLAFAAEIRKASPER